VDRTIQSSNRLLSGTDTLFSLAEAGIGAGAWAAAFCGRWIGLFLSVDQDLRVFDLSGMCPARADFWPTPSPPCFLHVIHGFELGWCFQPLALNAPEWFGSGRGDLCAVFFPCLLFCEEQLQVLLDPALIE
jgi:hypothetical protein